MKFIVFEGIDGSGKTTLIKNLGEALNKRQLPWIQTREPGGTPLADEIRHLILRTGTEVPHPRTELLLYEASRSQHVANVIRPALQAGKWVLCDRFTASSIAFQSTGRNIPIEDVEMLNKFATGGLVPDLTVLLDLPVSESHRRQDIRNVQSQTKKDRIESESSTFHEAVRRSFLHQSQQNGWWVLDAQLSPEVLLQQLLDHLIDLQWLQINHRRI